MYTGALCYIREFMYKSPLFEGQGDRDQPLLLVL